MTEGSTPETSIVIRAFNEQRWLPEVLAAISGQRYASYEVIVVDSGSIDRTREIATEHGARVIRLRSEDFTFGHSLNFGIQAARGPFVAILSAHAIPSDENWLERLVSPLRDPVTAMVFGGQRGHSTSKFSESLDFQRIFRSTPERLKPPNYFANNANSAIRRDLWEKHPFDEGLPGLEDIEWAKHWMDRDRRVLYEPAAAIYHIHNESWPQVRRRYHREGIAARWVGIRSAQDIPSEILREMRWFMGDLKRAARAGKLLSVGGEVARFRFEKTVGTVIGILDGEGISNPAKRAEMYFQQSFPAVVIKAPREASLEKRVIPNLKPGELLVRVAYQGICATDLEIFEGALGYYKSGLAKYPIVPGHELSGTVAVTGARVTDLNEGDRVVVECIQGCGHCQQCANDNAIACKERREVGVMGHDGGYATFLVTRARYAHRVPEGVDLAEAALAEPLAVVLKAMRRLGASNQSVESRSCAVVGGGTIGHLCALILELRGHRVTVFDRDTARLARFNGTIGTDSTLEGLDRFDWLVEATGDQDVLERVLAKSRTGATLLLLGLPYEQRSFSFESIVGFDRTVIGSVGSTGQDFADALELLPRLNTKPFLESVYPLDSFKKAWDAVRSRQHLKTMLRVDEGET